MVAERPPDPSDLIRQTGELFDTSLQAVIGTDLQGRILYWNETAERMYGWTADEVHGRNVVEVTPTDLSRVQAEEIMARLRRGQSWTGEFRVRRRDGAEFHVRVRNLPVLDAQGDLVGLVGTSLLALHDKADRRAT